MPNIGPMKSAHSPESESAVEVSARQLWDAAVGRVFKLAHKNYGVRTLTYTQVKAVRDAKAPGAFEIEVFFAEITGRTLIGKRMFSNICKEGVLQEDAATELQPESFGTECSLAEFEKVTSAILTYTHGSLDRAMQADSEQRTEINVPVDLGHLTLTEMEASLVRNSPFLAKNLYFLTANSIPAAETAIQQELKRALRGGDDGDAAYVAQKNEAVASLQAKLQSATQEMEALRILASVEAQQHDHQVLERRRPGFATLQIDSLALALLGRPGATTVRWMSANPSEEGPVYCLSGQYAPLEFVRWAHITGRTVTDMEGASRKLTDYFKGMNQSYTGPDRGGIYPLLKAVTE